MLSEPDLVPRSSLEAEDGYTRFHALQNVGQAPRVEEVELPFLLLHTSTASSGEHSNDTRRAQELSRIEKSGLDLQVAARDIREVPASKSGQSRGVLCEVQQNGKIGGSHKKWTKPHKVRQ